MDRGYPIISVMPMFRKGLLALACLLGLVVSSAASNVRAEGAVVVVNEVPVFRLRSRAVDGTSPEARAQRIADILENTVDTSTVTIKRDRSNHILFLDEVRLVTITPSEAKLQLSTTAALAVQWASRLQSAFALPALKLSAVSITTYPGDNKVIKLQGSWAHLAEVQVDNSQVATATRIPGGIKVQTVGVGDATVSVAYPDGLQTIEVSVRPWAVNLPQNLVATVTGYPASAETVKGAIESALRTQLVAQPQTKVDFELGSPSLLSEGMARTIPVKISASAPNAFDRAGSVNVLVRNLGLVSRKDAELWYSNDPENVKQAGPLFSAPVVSNVPIRLLYHHINASTAPLYIRVQVVNDSDESAQIALMPGDCPPDKNPVRAGLKAALQYFRAWTSSSGEVVTIPAHSTIPISLRRLAVGETTSGLCGLRLVSGPKSVLLRTDAWPPFPLEANWQPALVSSTPWRIVGSHPINDFDRAPYQASLHIYPNPYRVEGVQYSVGGRYGFVRIGQKPIARQDRTSQLDGNFGVIYNIDANVENKTAEATEIEVVFESSAGYSGGIFFVDGQVVETPLMQPKAETRIARFRVEPGSVKKFAIVTVPLSGSSYPATITIRPMQPLSAGIAGNR